MAFFILGGFSETTLALQIGMLGIGFAGFWFWRGRKGQVHWELLLSALAGSLISLVVVFLSPANALRQASFLSPPTIVELISMSFYNAFAFLHDSFQANGFRSLIGFLIPMLLFYCIYARDARPRKISPASLTVWLMIAPLIVYLLMVCVCAPSAYGSSSYPEDRVLIYGTFLLNALIVLEGALVGIILGQLHHYARQPVPPFMRWAALVLFFLLSLYPIYNLPKTLAEVPGYRDWAEAWDARDAQIRTQAAQGITDVEVTAFDSIYLVLELGPDPNEWVNGCAAHYYGVNSITAHLP
jgi:hypothetical protein